MWYDSIMNSDKNLDSAYVKSYYDNFLSSYDKEYYYFRWQAGPVEKIHFKQTRRALLPYLTSLKGNVLEIGGGDAVWTREYIEKINNLTFLDISKEMITRAQNNLKSFDKNITYINEDFLKADLKKDNFNHIVSIRNLEYFTDKKYFIFKVKELLKKDGTFVLVTKSPKYNIKDSDKRKTLHTSQIDIKQLVNLLRNNGLYVLAVYPAIFGKLFRFSLTRFLANLIHKIILLLPYKILPISLLSYFSESFVIYAKK